MDGTLRKSRLHFVRLALAGVCLGAAALSAAPGEKGAGADHEIIEMTYAVKAPAPEAALRAFRRAAEERGGYLVVMDSAGCTVDVPARIGVEEAQKMVAALGTVVERNINRRAVGGEIADLGARIRARRDHLKRLEELFKDVDLAQTLALEKETSTALGQLDAVRGQLNYLKTRSRMLRLTIRLESTASVRPRHSIPLSAPWVGTLTIENFLARFGQR